MSQDYHGSCLCKGITFSVTSFSELAAHCHCSMCRKFHGAAYGTLVGVRGLKWLSGKSLIRKFHADNGTRRYFCDKCGSSLAFLSASQDESQLEMAIAAFDTEIPVTPDAHIFTDYKACWSTINDGLRVFKEHRE